MPPHLLTCIENVTYIIYLHMHTSHFINPLLLFLTPYMRNTSYILQIFQKYIILKQNKLYVVLVFILIFKLQTTGSHQNNILQPTPQDAARYLLAYYSFFQRIQFTIHRWSIRAEDHSWIFVTDQHIGDCLQWLFVGSGPDKF